MAKITISIDELDENHSLYAIVEEREEDGGWVKNAAGPIYAGTTRTFDVRQGSQRIIISEEGAL